MISPFLTVVQIILWLGALWLFGMHAMPRLIFAWARAQAAGAALGRQQAARFHIKKEAPHGSQ